MFRRSKNCILPVSSIIKFEPMATSERESAGKRSGGEKLAATLPSVSSRTGKVNPLSLAHAAVFSLLSRTSMMRTWTFLSLYSFQSASRCGASALQNGHQLVAKWMTTNLPRRSARGNFFTLQVFQGKCWGSFADFRLRKLFCKTLCRNCHQKQQKQKNSIFKGKNLIRQINYPQWSFSKDKEKRR